jgi:hypothetical protein
MNTVPAIGRARGLFEIFVPGSFSSAESRGCALSASA